MCFGFLRIYGYLLTKSLWLSMGMHIGWNFFQGPIFGFAASGHQTATLIQHEVVSSSTYLTGGDFGPEASLLILPILGLALWSMKQYRDGQMARAQLATSA
jgi:membrane protease YdiL (CAAX protease family)